MTNDLAAQAKLNPKQQLVVRRKNEIQSIESDLKKMLPPSLPSDKFIRTVQTAVTLNPDIAEADKNSVLNACMKAAADGLVLDGREAAITIYNTKQKDGTWKKQAQYIPMVAGIIKRVRNSGEVSRLNAFIVHENDTFHVAYGLDMTIRHEPNLLDPGKAVGAYATCLFKDGESDFEFMSVRQIESIRERSKAKDSGPWKTDWAEMARKTVIRRLSKRLPMDSDIARVVEQIDDDYEPDQTAPYADADGVIEHQPHEQPPKQAGKAKGSAAAKLNQQPVAEVIEAEAEEIDSDEMPESAEGQGDGESYEDII